MKINMMMVMSKYLLSDKFIKMKRARFGDELP